MQKNEMRVGKFTKDELKVRGLKTANYQREIMREHALCQMQNNAVVRVKFDDTQRRHYVDCSDCAIYFKETKEIGEVMK